MIPLGQAIASQDIDSVFLDGTLAWTAELAETRVCYSIVFIVARSN